MIIWVIFLFVICVFMLYCIMVGGCVILIWNELFFLYNGILNFIDGVINFKEICYWMLKYIFNVSWR